MNKKLYIILIGLLFSVVASAQQHKEHVFKEVEVMPEYKGGDDSLYAYIYRNLEYPADAKQDLISGTVIISFIVNTEGEITDAEVARDIGGNCGIEALRVVNAMPDWKPGMQGGEKVNVAIRLPVRFAYPDE